MIDLSHPRIEELFLSQVNTATRQSLVEPNTIDRIERLRSTGTISLEQTWKERRFSLPEDRWETDEEVVELEDPDPVIIRIKRKKKKAKRKQKAKHTRRS